MSSSRYTVLLPGLTRTSYGPSDPWTSRISRRTLLLACGTLFCVVLLLGAKHTSAPTALTALFSNGHGAKLRHTVRAAVEEATAANPASANYDWTEGADGPKKPRPIGTPLSFIDLPNSEVVDSRTSEAFTEEFEDGGAFNLAVLKLPPGSDFQVLGIARGPTRKHPFMKIEKWDAREQSLVVFGLNINSDGSMKLATKAHALDYQQIPSERCINAGFWVSTFGVEDARIFWTDAGTPAISLGRVADRADSCRVVGLIPDIRRYFPFVDKAIKTSRQYGVTRFSGKIMSGQGKSFELRRVARTTYVEKNWAAFFPGPRPDPTMHYPFISYTVAPAVLMTINSSDARSLTYQAEPESAMSADAYHCVSRYHPTFKLNTLHHASPLYRFTLCPRGTCEPNEGNTVNIAVAHSKQKMRYVKYFIAYNVTAPFNPITISPASYVEGVKPDGTEIHDMKAYNFALSLMPLEAADLDPTMRHINAGQGLTPGHIFLDDNVLMTMGHADGHMVSTMFAAREMLARAKFCEGPEDGSDQDQAQQEKEIRT